MDQTTATVATLVLLAVVAVASPLLSELTGRIGVPDVVIQLGLGIVIGPEVLGLAHDTVVVSTLSEMGLSFLMFMAGYELDLGRVRGRPLELAGAGWVLSLALGLAAAAALVSSGIGISVVIIGLALTTTALGTLLPVLSDAGLTNTRFGTYLMAIGTVGEFGPILAVAVLLDNRDPAQTGLFLFFFVGLAVGLTVMAARTHPPKVVALMRRHLHSSAQLPVRVSVLLITLLVYVAFELGIDVLLGAFAAGIVIRQFAVRDDNAAVTAKLEAIGFGYFVPIFFITSGMSFDGHALVAHPSAWLRLPLFLALFLVVRGVPALLLYRRDLPRAELAPLAFFSATGLPLIVVITSIGVSEGRMRPENAAALVGAGMLSVLIYPLAAKTRLHRVGTEPAVTAAEDGRGIPTGVDPGAPPPLGPARPATPEPLTGGITSMDPDPLGDGFTPMTDENRFGLDPGGGPRRDTGP